MSAESVRPGVDLVRRGNVAELWLDNPPVNAMNPQVWQSLASYLDELSLDQDLALLILRGRNRGFCGGADLKFSPRMDDATRKVQHRLELATITALYDFPAATLCVVHGFAIGAGISLAVMSDLRVASADAKFSMPEIDWGLSVGSGGARIRRLGVRTGRVREILMTGRKFAASEAGEMGLVDYVVAAEELDGKVEELENVLGQKNPRLMRIMKAGLNAAERAGDWERGNQASYEFTVQMRKAANPEALAAPFFERDRSAGG